MLKNFLLGLTGNTAIVLGNNNINIQDIQHSTININSLDIEQIKQALSDFSKHTKKPLYFVVYAKFEPNMPHDWKPFGKDTILQIIQSCVIGLPETKSVVWFIDDSDDLDEDTTDELKAIAPETVLVFSTHSLHQGELYNCFNRHQIGGCIAVPSLEIMKYPKHLGTLTRVRTKIDNIHKHKKTFQYALKHVHTDDDIAENINNIITAYMGHTHHPTISITTTDTHSQNATQKTMKL